VREHTDTHVRQQGGRQESAGENKDGNLPQEEESPVLRDFRQEQLQLREALSHYLATKLTGWVLDAALLHCCFDLSV
jgi:hypothetical protein